MDTSPIRHFKRETNDYCPTIRLPVRLFTHIVSNRIRKRDHRAHCGQCERSAVIKSFPSSLLLRLTHTCSRYEYAQRAISTIFNADPGCDAAPSFRKIVRVSAENPRKGQSGHNLSSLFSAALVKYPLSIFNTHMSPALNIPLLCRHPIIRAMMIV